MGERISRLTRKQALSLQTVLLSMLQEASGRRPASSDLQQRPQDALFTAI